jgi:hypothetical protein
MIGQRRQRPLGPSDPRQSTRTRQGLTTYQVEALRERQRGSCALCGHPLGDTFAVDHDHRLAKAHGHNPETGCPRCVRGLLDWRCNGFLVGDYGEPEFLMRAARYAASRRS